MNSKNNKKTRCNLAIAGGGKICDYFLNLVEDKVFQYFDIKIVGVWDTDPSAPGIVFAKKMKIFTTQNIEQIFKIKDLDILLELTGNKSLGQLLTLRPDNVGIIENNLGNFLKKIFETDNHFTWKKDKIAYDKAHYDILFQQRNLGVVVLDPEFVIVDANHVYLKSVKKQSSDVIGKKCHTVVKGFFAPCPLEEPGFECPLQKSLETGKSSQIIHEHTMPDGSSAYFDITTYPVKNQKNQIIHVIELWRDITMEITQKWENRVKQIHADMKKIIQEDRLVSLGKLVASSVHEINNPIQGLLTFSHLMKDMVKQKSLNPDEMDLMREFTSHMSRELERCGNIVSSLLAFSREAALEYINTDINMILETVLSLTGHKLKLSDITLETRLSSFPLFVHGDINQLQQCFLNLIFNAIAAMPRGGKLSIDSGLDQDQIWIKICDNGCGINDNDMEHIFDPFFTTKPEGEGTGLGLSIVYGIIKDHEGDIKVKSLPEQGTSFIISLPCIKTDPNL